jgi:hypothetical protein
MRMVQARHYAPENHQNAPPWLCDPSGNLSTKKLGDIEPLINGSKFLLFASWLVALAAFLTGHSFGNRM